MAPLTLCPRPCHFLLVTFRIAFHGQMPTLVQLPVGAGQMELCDRRCWWLRPALSTIISRAMLIEGVMARPGNVFNLLNVTHGQIGRQPRVMEKIEFSNKEFGVQFPTLELNDCVTLSKLPKPSEPHPPVSKVEIREDQMECCMCKRAVSCVAPRPWKAHYLPRPILSIKSSVVGLLCIPS